MQLTDIFNISLVGRAKETAVEFEDATGKSSSLTFGELDARSNQFANLFLSLGLKCGDRLGFFLQNRVEIIDIFLACVKTGIIIVPINILYRTRELAHIITDAEPKAVITTSETAWLIESGTEVWDVAEISKSALEFDKNFERISIDGDEAAAIVYTSGTTGRSKGAILTHNNFAANAVNLTACWRITDADRYLAVLPLFHVHGLGNGVACWLLSGCLMRLTERFDIKTAPEMFESFKPTLFFGVPTVYVRLLELPEETAKRIGEKIRLFVCGSAPLPPNVLEEFQQKFGHTILERYGMSETLMNLSNPYEGERRAGSVGFPLPGVSVKIVDSEMNSVSDGEIGELLVRGANVCAGYWNRPDATEEAFIDGWFRTGDLAEKSAGGYFTIINTLVEAMHFQCKTLVVLPPSL